MCINFTQDIKGALHNTCYKTEGLAQIGLKTMEF